MVFIVILAGGGGERLWPLSRKDLPKQFISLNGKKSLLQKTYDMAVQIVGEDNVLVSTRRGLESIIRNHLHNVRMIVEPLGRDSAAGMGYVCAKLLYENNDEPVIFMGADYYIPRITHFKEVLSTAVQYAEKGKISTIGIKPTRNETRFGYINPGKLLSHPKSIPVFEAKNFTEKPSEFLAQKYIDEGYLWNSGMFIVKPSILFLNIQKFMPHLYEALKKIQATHFNEEKGKKTFNSLSKVSIDYGIMEKTEDLVVIKGNFKWDDIGTWDSLDRILKSDKEGNIIQEELEFIGIDVQNNVIFGQKPVIAYGISDTVIIDSKDCLFICRKDLALQIKKVTTIIEKHPNLKRLLKYNKE